MKSSHVVKHYDYKLQALKDAWKKEDDYFDIIGFSKEKPYMETFRWDRLSYLVGIVIGFIILLIMWR